MIVSVMICVVFGYGKVGEVGAFAERFGWLEAIFLNEKNDYRMVA